MRYAKLIPTALMAIAATATGLACTAKSTDADSLTQAQAGLKPPGNNGTVKIQEVGDNEEIPDNDPHVGCRFQIEFRGFDEGAYTASWTLEGQPPSGQTHIVTKEVPIGEDPAGGANDVDAIVVVDLADYDLSTLEVHPQQGIHLKLTVHAEGSIGADTKHKVFWVQGCSAPPPPPPSGSSSSSGGDTPPPPTPDAGSSSGSSGRTW